MSTGDLTQNEELQPQALAVEGEDLSDFDFDDLQPDAEPVDTEGSPERSDPGINSQAQLVQPERWSYERPKPKKKAIRKGRRKASARTQQLNVRCDPDLLQAFFNRLDELGIPATEGLERMMRLWLRDESRE